MSKATPTGRLAAEIQRLAESNATTADALDDVSADVDDVRATLTDHTRRLVRLEAAGRRKSTGAAWGSVRNEAAALTAAGLAHLRKHPARVALTLAGLAGILGWDRLAAALTALVGGP